MSKKLEPYQDTIPKGVTCPHCEKYTEFPAYVFAHWHEELKFTCDCGEDMIIIQGELTE